MLVPLVCGPTALQQIRFRIQPGLASSAWPPPRIAAASSFKQALSVLASGIIQAPLSIPLLLVHGLKSGMGRRPFRLAEMPACHKIMALEFTHFHRKRSASFAALVLAACRAACALGQP